MKDVAEGMTARRDMYDSTNIYVRTLDVDADF